MSVRTFRETLETELFSLLADTATASRARSLLSASLADARIHKAMASARGRERFGQRVSAVRSKTAGRSHTIPHVLDPTRPAVPRKRAHSRLRTATSNPSSSSHRSHTHDPTRSHVLDPTRPAASITQVYQQLRLTVTSKTTTYVSHLDLSLLLRCVCFEQHDDQGFEVSDR